jgi:hypothetical protein
VSFNGYGRSKKGTQNGPRSWRAAKRYRDRPRGVKSGAAPSEFAALIGIGAIADAIAAAGVDDDASRATRHRHRAWTNVARRAQVRHGAREPRVTDRWWLRFIGRPRRSRRIDRVSRGSRSRSKRRSVLTVIDRHGMKCDEMIATKIRSLSHHTQQADSIASIFLRTRASGLRLPAASIDVIAPRRAGGLLRSHIRS